MQKTDTLYTAYVEVLKEELLPAMGCTEPIAIAYAAAAARRRSRLIWSTRRSP